MRIPRLRLALVLLLFLGSAMGLAACGKDGADNTSPERAVTQAAQLLKKGDIDGFWKHMLPPADYRKMRADWGKDRAGLDKATAEDRRRFAEGMARLTAPDAQQTMFAQIKPQLEAYDKAYKTRMPMMVGMGQAVIGTQIDNARELTTAQKQQARDAVAALAQWAGQVPWGDQDKARQAIGVITAHARKLDIETLDQAYSLDYNAAMDKYAQLWDGLKQLLGIYGLSLDRTLDSVKAKTVSSENGTARVEVDYTLLDKPMHGTVTMVREDGHWYDRDFLASWRRKRSAPAAAGTVVAAPAVAASTAGSAAPAGAR